MNAGAALIIKSCGTDISANVRDGALCHKLKIFWKILYFNRHQNSTICSKVTAFLLNWCLDYFALWHCRNPKLTLESPQMCSRWPQTPDKVIGTLCEKRATQEVFFMVLCTGGLSCLISWAR